MFQVMNRIESDRNESTFRIRFLYRILNVAVSLFAATFVFVVPEERGEDVGRSLRPFFGLYLTTGNYKCSCSEVSNT
jgi:hypothetical protein